MYIEQISVFMENRRGRLSGLIRTLAQNGIDLLAVTVADTADFGVFRAVVNNTHKAESILRSAGYTVSITKVLGVKVSNTPGGLAKVLDLFTAQEISVEYLYSLVGEKGEDATIIFKVDNIDRATDVLACNGFVAVTQGDIGAKEGD